jgi:hypothetical protein
MFSVMKRKFGESFKARKYRLQVKEIKIKVILYNLSKLMNSVLVIIEGFYKAQKKTRLCYPTLSMRSTNRHVSPTAQAD